MSTENQSAEPKSSADEFSDKKPSSVQERDFFGPTGEHTAIPEDVLTNTPLPSPPCDLDTYTLNHLFAEGGTARVYRAFESHSKQPIAIKMLRRRFHHDTLLNSAFRRHGQALKQLRLPHFANVLDAGDSRWGPWWAIEWVEGETLRSMLARGHHWDSRRLLPLMIQLCEALEALHELNMTHGDLKSDNVIYSKPSQQDAQELLTLIDLALPLSLNLENNLLHPDEPAPSEVKLNDPVQAFGDPSYMAPEILRGELPSPQSDLYSLGVLFFELTTHHLPFTRPFPELIHDVLTRAAPLASRIQKPWPYPPALDALIRNLLSKRPQDRCLSVLEVKKQLKHMLRELGRDRSMTTTEEFSGERLRELRDQILGEQGGLASEDTEIRLTHSPPTAVSRPTHRSARIVHTSPKRDRTRFIVQKILLWISIGILISFCFLKLIKINH